MANREHKAEVGARARVPTRAASIPRGLMMGCGLFILVLAAAIAFVLFVDISPILPPIRAL